jgi:hypothetical protein
MLSPLAVPRNYKEESCGNQVSSVLEVVKNINSWKKVGRKPPFRESLGAEAEESPLL